MQKVLSSYSLMNFNTFNIDIKASFFTTITSEDDLVSLSQQKSIIQTPILILGGGSNILFCSDYEGLVIKNDIQSLWRLTELEDDNTVFIKVGAGISWHQFVCHCIDNNWQGIENLSLIPGLVGATPVQNIGAYGVEVKDVIYKVEGYWLDTQKKEEFSANKCNFAYRSSIFKSEEFKNKFFITYVTFILQKNSKNFNLSYPNVKQELHNMGVTDITLQTVSFAISRIRQKKLLDVQKVGNAGSFFKNPILDVVQLDYLKTKYSNIPSFQVNDNTYKVPAAWFIEQAGFKGKKYIIDNRIFGVSPNQAVVLANWQGSLGQDVLSLAHKIQNVVKYLFNITLEFEVEVIGNNNI